MLNTKCILRCANIESMNLPRLQNLGVFRKRVIVRMDFDVPEEDYSRIEVSKETLDYLLQKKAKVILIGHKGRPEGSISLSLSLRKLAPVLTKILKEQVMFIDGMDFTEIKATITQTSNIKIFLLENLRFDPREENNDEGFAKKLADLADVYVNEAFAVSHRVHASIVGIPKQFKSKFKNSVAAGFRFIREVEHLSQVIENPKRPLLILISGIKEDKIEMIESLTKIADKILVGGRLPLLIQKSKIKNQNRVRLDQNNISKIKIAKLTQDGLDIDEKSTQVFEQEIKKARTIVLAGVVGKYEDERHQQGTKRIFKAVANSEAYKVAGGGDTEAALTMYNLTDKFDWISVGGGAMLEFLAKGTLPGIEILID